MRPPRRAGTLVPAACALLSLIAAPAAAQPAPRDRDAWVALVRGGFIVPEGQSATGLLVEMNALLASGASADASALDACAGQWVEARQAGAGLYARSSFG